MRVPGTADIFSGEGNSKFILWSSLVVPTDRARSKEVRGYWNVGFAETGSSSSLSWSLKWWWWWWELSALESRIGDDNSVMDRLIWWRGRCGREGFDLDALGLSGLFLEDIVSWSRTGQKAGQCVMDPYWSRWSKGRKCRSLGTEEWNRIARSLL